MPAQSSMHFYLNWAKERIDEMDATLASLEAKASQVQADFKVKANQLIADLKKRRDEFQAAVKQQAEAGEAGWTAPKHNWNPNGTASKRKLKPTSIPSANISSSSRRRSGMWPLLKWRLGARLPTNSMTEQQNWPPNGAPTSTPQSNK